jgi:hypothetical protein
MSSVLMNLIRTIFLLFMVVGCTSRAAILNTELIILLDSTGSVSAVEEEYKKEVRGIIDFLPENSCVTILAITEDSFGGYEKIIDRDCIVGRQYLVDTKPRENRNRIIHAFNKNIHLYGAKRTTSDILGAICYAERLFPPFKHANSKILLIFSDMRHNARGINISGVSEIPIDILSKVRDQKLIAQLQGVKIWALGIHTLNKNTRYMDSLHNFWKEYFKESGASLEAFSSSSKGYTTANFK